MNRSRLVASIRVAGLAAGCAATIAHAQTQCGSEDAKVSPAMGQAGDGFGASLDTAAAGFGIVGAPDAGVDGAGRAYLYTLNTTIPQLLFELSASDGANGIDFGRSVAADNALALVGAPAESTLGPAAGAAYLYLRATGMQIDKLTASDGRGLDLFGNALDLDFDRMVVCASDKASSAGAAYVFEVVGLDAVERFKLTPTDAASVDRFGSSISIDGGGVTAGEVGYALIGAPGNDDAGASSGSAYLFNIETGQQAAKLVASDASAGVGFGFSVELLIQDGIALAAVAADTANPDGSRGAVYLFDVSDRANPVELSKITANDPVTAGNFGVSISMAPGVLMVGALSGETTRAGTAYTFDITDPTSPVRTAIIRPSEPVAFALFGASAALYDGPAGLRLFAGAPGDDAGEPIAGAPDVGALHALTIGTCRPDIDGDCILTIFDFL
ncbi:MAG: hypothetical protein ACIAQU_07525, partial [Phycisphaerales bacterium JB064]